MMVVREAASPSEEATETVLGKTMDELEEEVKGIQVRAR